MFLWRCVACLDVLAVRGRVTPSVLAEGKRQLRTIVSRLIALINSITDRVSDETATYQMDNGFSE